MQALIAQPTDSPVKSDFQQTSSQQRPFMLQEIWLAAPMDFSEDFG